MDEGEELWVWGVGLGYGFWVWAWGVGLGFVKGGVGWGKGEDHGIGGEKGRRIMGLGKMRGEKEVWEGGKGGGCEGGGGKGEGREGVREEA